MIIQTLHQPFVFIENAELKIICSQTPTEKLLFQFGDSSVIEDYWKLKFLDINGNITNVVTPSTITVNEVSQNVIAECNGFIYYNKISYIAGVHNGQNNVPMYYYLVTGDIDFNTNIVSNITIIDNDRTGYVKGSDVYHVDYRSSSVMKNHSYIFTLNGYLDLIIRIIGVYNENKMIITGNKNGVLKSYVYSLDTEELFLLKNSEDNNIYKSSYLGNELDGTLVYAQRITLGPNNFDHYVNIETGYILETPEPLTTPTITPTPSPT